MKNLKFILKCILALIPIIATVVYTALVPFGYMDSEYSAWKYSKDVSKNVARFSTDASDTTTLILGDSRAMADFLPEMFDNTCMNLAVGGATSIEMYYTLKEYIDNNGKPENVIIAFAPFHYTIIDNFWTRTVYFNYLSITDIDELYSYAEVTKSETLLKKGYKNDLLSYRLRFPDKYLPALINSKLIGRYSENKSSYDDISSNSGYGPFGTADGSSDLNYEVGYDKMHTTGDALLLDIYMNRLLQLCVDNNIPTTLTIPPMNRSSYEKLQDSYVDELTYHLENLASRYKKVNVESIIPMYDDEFFGDSSHLNLKGATLYTEEYISNHIK